MWGRCQQRTHLESRKCSAHDVWDRIGATPDPYYHQKVVEGVISPTFDYLTDSEANASVKGRYRGDGRRLDQFVTGDPCLVDLVDV